VPRHSEHKVWATNVAKFMVKKAKTDTEKRRWMNIFLVLTELIDVEIIDDTSAKPALANEVPMPSIDDEVAAKLKRIKNGGDDAQLPDS
jgi:hypothetical protein